MPFAADGKVSTESFEGALEISDEEYSQAVDGMCSGLVVTISGGFRVGPAPTVEPEPAPPPTLEQLTASALAQKDQLLALAAIRIAPLSDAVELGDASDADVANLKLWRQYRVAVNRVQDQPGFPENINWPVTPN